MNNYRQIKKTLAATAVLSFGLMLGAAPQARAEDHRECQERVERAEGRLDQAVRKHGERSRQAEDRRRDLNAERERCWSRYHGWWDGRAHQWRTDRDWDDHDHH